MSSIGRRESDCRVPPPYTHSLLTTAAYPESPLRRRIPTVSLSPPYTHSLLTTAGYPESPLPAYPQFPYHRRVS